MDISKRRRGEMVTVSERLFGKDKVAPICTFNSLSTKVAIKDIGKVLDARGIYKIPYSLRDEVAKAIPTIKTLDDLGEESEKEMLLKDVLGGNEKLRGIYDKFPLWFQLVMKLEGSPKSLGRHAAGTIISDKPLLEYAPLCLDSDGNQMLQLEMHNAMDDLGLIKMDFLGLKTLDVVDDCLKLIGKTWDDFNINTLDLNDKEVYDNIYKKGNTIGIFQMESAEARKMCIEAQADSIEDVIAINAFNRPGTKNSFPTYCSNKKDPNNIKLIHEDLKEILGKTYCVLLYQEQTLQMFRYTKFKEEDVDNARRCLDENTLISLSNGEKVKIKNIKIGDEVVSFTKNGKVEHKKVKNVFDNGYKQTYKIETLYNNEIIGTKDHKILTNFGWKTISELSIDDYVMIPKRNISVNDNVLSKYKPCPELMFLIGLLIGDGTIYDKSLLAFTNSDKDIINKFKQCCNKLLNSKSECKFIESFGSRNKDVINIKIQKKQKNDYYSALLKLLNKYDLIKYSKDKKLPVEFMNDINGIRILNLLGGLFSTDGVYYNGNNSVGYSTVSKILAEQIQQLLLKYGIFSYVSKKEINYEYKNNNREHSKICYEIIISQSSSLIQFEKNILPYIVGYKKECFKNIINNVKNNNKLYYNYILPPQYSDEILNSAKESNISINELGRLCGYKDGNFKVSSTITDVKAKNIINHIYTPELYKILMSDYIPVKIKSIKEHKVCHVFDIEVEDNHNYVANNIIVHNCVGKKDMKTMKSLKLDFTKGLSQKGWKEYQIEEMWALIEKQAEYSFNRGHSVAYALLSYLTAYLKQHYPLEFITACLNNEIDNTGKTGVLLDECRRLGINVLPPNINKSKEYYTPDKETNSILYGFTPIKGIGENASKTIIEHQPYKGFKDFLNKIQGTSVNSIAIKALIKSGAIPCKSKNKMLKIYADSQYVKREYNDVSTLPKLSILKDKWGIDSSIIKDKEERLRLYNNKRRLEFEKLENERYKQYLKDFKDKYVGDETLYEFETLSMFLTNNPFKDLSSHMINFSEVEDGNECTVLCSIVEVKRKKDKKGKAFAYLDLFTSEGIIEGICWASSYGKYQSLIGKGKHIVVLGTKKEDKLIVGKIKELQQWKKEMGIK